MTKANDRCCGNCLSGELLGGGGVCCMEMANETIGANGEFALPTMARGDVCEHWQSERVCGNCLNYWYRVDPDLDRYSGDGCCVAHEAKRMGNDTCAQWTAGGQGAAEADDVTS